MVSLELQQDRSTTPVPCFRPSHQGGRHGARNGASLWQGAEAGPSTGGNSHTEKPTLPTWAQVPGEDLGHQIIHVL